MNSLVYQLPSKQKELLQALCREGKTQSITSKKFLDFYRTFPQILDTVRLKSIRLTWSHYRTLLQERDPESDLENAIISNLQKFLMELGKGYAFVARQQHIHTEKEDYYIDLVFYNYLLKCFVLIDLKTTKVTHQDIGQMDMYRRMYDELKRTDGDNPTLGIILCADTDEDIARYSILHGNEQLFATKYKLLLPTEEQLRAEIEAQKNIYLLQQED